MGALVWVMIGIALWHFAIFVPDHFWSGIVGAFLGAVVGSFLFGFLIHGLSVPGQSDTNILSAIEAVPGANILESRPRAWLGQERLYPAI